MCGRFSFYYEWRIVLQAYGLLGEPPAPPPRYNIAPGQMVQAVVSDGTNRKIGALRWGLVPNWAKDEATGYKMINVRAETLMEKPAFLRLMERHRCIIPADGFYEWRKDGRNKQPLRITLRSRPVFGFAGLWDVWTRADGTRLGTCTIITCAANELMSQIHDRMPVILTAESERLWLDRSITDAKQLVDVLRPYPGADMQAYPVSPALGNWRNEGPELIQESENFS